VSTTWTHELPIRWSDLDQLNHVTNVVYLDYASEAQAVLCHEGHLDPGRPVADVTVTYLRPIALSRTPLLLRSTLDESVLTQEVCVAKTAEPIVHATIVSTYGDPSPEDLGMAHADSEPLDARVRMTDLDATGSVSLSGQFRLAQESRILHFARMGRERLGQFVVARISLQPLAPIAWRLEPYRATSRITRVGGGSFTIDTTLATSTSPVFTSQTVLVGFDRETQSSRPFANDEREHLLAQLSP
jgi:acyl-CoA thioesterase FadM